MASANVPVKVVLKSTTTQTLSDRFTEMMQKTPSARTTDGGGRRGGPNRQDTSNNVRASAKNRRLAEQMSRRSGIEEVDEAPISRKGPGNRGGPGNCTANGRTGSVKERIDQSKIRSNVRDRLGAVRGGRGNNRGRVTDRISLGSQQRGGRPNRGGFASRGGNPNRGGFSASRGGRGKNFSRGNGGFTQRNGYQNQGNRGRGGGRGGRGNFRGRGGRGRGNNSGSKNRDQLDSELDSYMSTSNWK